jgi:hypothetical protein
MNQQWPPYNIPAFESMGSLDRHDNLVYLVQDAATQGVFPTQSSSKSVDIAKAVQQSKIATFRKRLYLLGYLQVADPTPADDDLNAALNQFQSEANMVITGQFDQNTWHALEALTSFEHPIHLQQWYEDQTPSPALMRAIRLRLFVFGWLKHEFDSPDRKVKSALEQFTEVAALFNLSPTPLNADFSQETISLLFDQDRILKAVAQSWEGTSFQLNPATGIREKKAEKIIQPFLVNLAKVELWLHGYNPLLNGEDDFEVPNTEDYSPSDYLTFHTCYEFWLDSGLEPQFAWGYASKIDGNIFQKIYQAHQEGTDIDHSISSQYVYETLSQEDPDIVHKVWQNIQSLGSRIWDGLKRAWNWLKNKIGSLIRKATTWVSNLARMAYHYAFKSFPTLAGIVNAVKSTVTLLTHKVFPGSTAGTVLIQHDLDFDFHLFFNEKASSEQTIPVIQTFISKAAVFRIGLEIMGIMLSSLITVGKQVILGGGWLGFIMALIKIVPDLKQVGVLGQEDLALHKTQPALVEQNN